MERASGTAIVIGAGIGGLATAVRLAHAGFRVTVLEQHAGPGGRAGVWRSEGFTFDTGPSMVMMRECWDELFALVGRKLSDYVTLAQCDPCYRLHFADGSTLEMTSTLDRLIEHFEAFEPGVRERALQWFADTGELYQRGMQFISRNMHRPQAMLQVGSMGLKHGTRALGDLQKMVSRYFTDRRLREAVTFQSLYLGLSPYKSLGVYGLLAHTEVAGGIHYPMGGMHQLANAFERLGRELGVTHEYDARVARLERGRDRIERVVLADGRTLTADVIVANSDLPFTYDRLLDEPYPGIEGKEFSCSVVLLQLGVNRTYPHLLHHNLAVSRDLEASCHDLFVRRQMPDDPPYYVVAATRTDPGVAPPRCENLFVLVLAPSQDPARPLDWQRLGPEVAERTLIRMEEQLGCTGLRQHIVTQRIVTPSDFTLNFGSLRGEAFGLSHGLTQIGYFRPHNRHARYRNLYFVGQSTHPGCGLPMVLISARCAVERIVEEVRPARSRVAPACAGASPP